LPVIERPVEAADGVMVGGGAAMLHRGRRAGRQHRHELVEHDPLVEKAADREVEAGAVGIDMGEASLAILVILPWKSDRRSQVMDVSKVEARIPRAAACSV